MHERAMEFVLTVTKNGIVSLTIINPFFSAALMTNI